MPSLHYMQSGFWASPCSPLPLDHRDARELAGGIRCLFGRDLHVHSLIIPAAGGGVNKVDQ